MTKNEQNPGDTVPLARRKASDLPATRAHTAVSTKVVQKKRKSVHDNAERSSGKYSINFK